jgi:hypothetical protein
MYDLQNSWMATTEGEEWSLYISYVCLICHHILGEFKLASVGQIVF